MCKTSNVEQLVGGHTVCATLLKCCLCCSVPGNRCSVPGNLPRGGALEGKGTFEGTPSDGGEENDTPEVRATKQTSSLMAILSSQDLSNAWMQTTTIWLGDGLGAIPK